jgi:hypothetical protein
VLPVALQPINPYPVQMAVVVDERQIITDAIIKYCKETVTDSTLQMQAAGSIDVTSDYDVTFLGLGGMMRIVGHDVEGTTTPSPPPPPAQQLPRRWLVALRHLP